MKKFLVILLIIMSMFTLVACKDKDEGNPDDKNNKPEGEVTQQDDEDFVEDVLSILDINY